MLSVIFISFIASACAGVVAGLLGGGIGLILIPTTLWLVQQMGTSPEIAMHVAIGTAGPSMMVMCSIAYYGHTKKNSVNNTVLKMMMPLLIIGCIAGAIFAEQISSTTLTMTFGIATALLALHVLLHRNKKQTSQQTSITPWFLRISALIIGGGCTVLGINPISVPLFRKIGMNMHQAIGTSTVVGLVGSTIITISYALQGFNATGLPMYSTGYVNWTLFIPLTIGSILFTPLGVRVAHSISHNTLKTLYFLLLLTVSAKMLVTAF